MKRIARYALGVAAILVGHVGGWVISTRYAIVDAHNTVARPTRVEWRG
jgi:hypothetical protein